ncbi:hypothetical protein DFJ58DRAFT_349393 [Suillus subalutaceus]|uniref:uncharacterized protein n=1 Tax=Suillus subalutaceus TaxID=48586 RepID=UPI001B883374|nr:uncharacterized protein DFJ58DRAFT_349393 [Suillus subalutaceus]KAG1855728.1 hypothetical protein DFJ58DRAFT_349393 [Suillus subalutaceus]
MGHCLVGLCLVFRRAHLTSISASHDQDAMTIFTRYDANLVTMTFIFMDPMLSQTAAADSEFSGESLVTDATESNKATHYPEHRLAAQAMFLRQFRVIRAVPACICDICLLFA